MSLTQLIPMPMNVGELIVHRELVDGSVLEVAVGVEFNLLSEKPTENTNVKPIRNDSLKLV